MNWAIQVIMCHQSINEATGPLGSISSRFVRPREIHQKALGNLFNGKGVLLTQPARSGKFIFFVGYPTVYSKIS